MACGSSYYEDNPAKDRLREEETAKKHLAMASKIAKFLIDKTRTPVVLVRSAASPHQVTKMRLECQEGTFTALHRGYAISVECSQPEQLSADFRSWIARDMTHITKIEPRV